MLEHRQKAEYLSPLFRFKSSLNQDRQEAVEDGTVRFEVLIQESD
jgi:hypothetical protein